MEIASTIFLLVLFLVLIGLGVVIFLLLRKKQDDGSRHEQERMFDEMKREMQEIKGEMKGSLEKNLEFVQKHSEQSNRTISDASKQSNMMFADITKVVAEVTGKLEKVESSNKQVVGFTEQLQNLQQVLTNPKHRGVLGEYYLETLLQNVLPAKNFEMQYKFADGEAVDAAVFVGDKVIPVDSKFSLENYNRLRQEEDDERRVKLEAQFKTDLKKRIDETSKYIRPSEDTFDFAFMFIPAEGIYYDLLVSQVGVVRVSTKDLLEYAFEKRVLIVSPNSFYAYLQTVLQGLRALSIEESAKEIRKNVEQLGKHMQTYEVYIQKLGNNLGTSVSMYNQAYKELGKVDKDVMKITGEKMGTDPVKLDKPHMEE